MSPTRPIHAWFRRLQPLERHLWVVPPAQGCLRRAHCHPRPGGGAPLPAGIL